MQSNGKINGKLPFSQAEDMINEIRTAFKDNFKNLHWMDKETLIEAEKKADAITDMIGNFSGGSSS